MKSDRRFEASTLFILEVYILLTHSRRRNIFRRRLNHKIINRNIEHLVGFLVCMFLCLPIFSLSERTINGDEKSEKVKRKITGHWSHRLVRLKYLPINFTDKLKAAVKR